MFWPTHAVARMVGTRWPGCSTVGIWSPCRIRGCERRRAPAPRSGYALDCRRQSGAEERGFAESDGALRDAMARGARELRCSCRPVWPVDRPSARPKATPWHRARHGFKREPDPRRAGDERLERPLRLHLLSPAVRVQPVWRPRTPCSACRQHAQRRRLGRRAQARCGALPGKGLTHLFSSGRSLCNARGLRVSGGGADQIRDPTTGRPGPAEQDRLSAHAPSRTTPAPCAPVPCQFQLSGRNLDQVTECYRQGRVAHPGELYPRVGFIVTNMSRPAERLVAFYNKRGTCEQWIKEGKGAIKWTRLSCRTFAATRCGSSFLRSPTTSAIFCARWRRRSRS